MKLPAETKIPTYDEFVDALDEWVSTHGKKPSRALLRDDIYWRYCSVLEAFVTSLGSTFRTEATPTCSIGNISGVLVGPADQQEVVIFYE